MHHRMNERENYLRAMEFRNPEWIPCSVNFSPITRKTYREELERIIINHPLIFRGYEEGDMNFDYFPPGHREGEYYRDNWGCLWYNVQDGLEGQVVENPLSDWEALDNYTPPDVYHKSQCGDRDWVKIEEDTEEKKGKGLLTIGDGERLFDRLYFLRGFENLMIDFATDAPQLPRLINMLLEYEMTLVNKWLEIGVDIIGFHTDIGTQRGLMISPAKFRQYIKPLFRKIFTTCREAGTHVALSSDGCLLEIVDDLVECGVSMHDPQLRANTLPGIEQTYKGKMCINLDLDRQMFPFCSPADIRQQIEEAVARLDSPEGGLMILASVYGANVPLQNIEAICNAMEKFCFRR